MASESSRDNWLTSASIRTSTRCRAGLPSSRPAACEDASGEVSRHEGRQVKSTWRGEESWNCGHC